MTDDIEQEEPLDPAVEAVRVKLVRLLMVSGGIMVLGLMAVVAAIVYKVNQTDVVPTLAASTTVGAIAIPKGSTVISSTVTERNLTLTLKLADGSTRIQIFDGAGRLKRQFAVIEE